jgi:alkylation response protein AidB-like acyl-CoA dehydrogenase
MASVDFELSEDQLALQGLARDLLDDRCDHDHVRAHLGTGRPFDIDLWKLMADQGWLGVALPEELGGIGMSWVEAAVLLEEVGRHTAPVPFLPSLLALSLLGAADRPPKERVADLAGGELIGCVAWSRHPGAVVATCGGDRWSLSGRVGPVEGAAVADLAVVAAGDSVFSVDLQAHGRPPAEPAMDGTRTLSWLVLDDTAATMLGGPELHRMLIDLGAIGTSAEMLGGAGRVLEMAVQYAKDRVQFGQPIGSFQAVKHRCADMVVDVEGMRSSTWYGAWAAATGESDASIAASTAKVWGSEAAKRVMASGLQVHGGIGFTWEHDLHLFMKRSQFEWASYGDASFHRQRLSDMLRERISSGAGVF